MIEVICIEDLNDSIMKLYGSSFEKGQKYKCIAYDKLYKIYFTDNKNYITMLELSFFNNFKLFAEYREERINEILNG